MSSHTASSRRLTRLAVAAIVATAVGVPASFAQVATSNDSDTPTITVKYSDLNLATSEGSRALYNRLVYAARQVCPPAGNAAELRQNRDAHSCISATVASAVKQVKNPQLAAVAAESQLR